MDDPTKTLLFRFVKLADISYISTCYFIMAITFGMFFDSLLGPFDQKDYVNKNPIFLVLELILQVCFLVCLAYITRNLFALVPSPFDGLSGLDHSRVNELKNAGVFWAALLWTQKNLADKLNYAYYRLFYWRYKAYEPPHQFWTLKKET